MQPGPELDALVAEKVMGLTVRYEDQPYELSPRGLHPGDDFIDKYGTRVPHYSTDIAAAWEVVAKLSIEGMWTLEGQDGVGWEAGFSRTLASPEQMFVADTAPHAICLAALAAVGVKL